MFNMYFDEDKNGRIVGCHNDEGIDEYMLETLQILKSLENKDLDVAIALMSTITTCVAEKYKMNGSDLAVRMLNILLKCEIADLRKAIEKCKEQPTK